jgi:hypothetical protein
MDRRQFYTDYAESGKYTIAKCNTYPVDAMLVVSDVLTNRRLAQLYTRVRQRDNATVGEIATDLDSSSTTVYER